MACKHWHRQRTCSNELAAASLLRRALTCAACPLQALHTSGGNDAATLRVAEQYIEVGRSWAEAALPASLIDLQAAATLLRLQLQQPGRTQDIATTHAPLPCMQAFKQLAKQSTTILLPAHTGDPSALMAQAMSIYKAVGPQQVAAGVAVGGDGGGTAGKPASGATAGPAASSTARLQNDIMGRILGAGPAAQHGPAAAGGAGAGGPAFSLSKGA
jgi:hypothetical protein